MSKAAERLRQLAEFKADWFDPLSHDRALLRAVADEHEAVHRELTFTTRKEFIEANLAKQNAHNKAEQIAEGGDDE